MEAEAVHWKTECHALRTLIEELEGKVDAQDACQTTLRSKVATLEQEKQDLQTRALALQDKVEKLTERIVQLEDENKRLKCIADKVQV